MKSDDAGQAPKVPSKAMFSEAAIGSMERCVPSVVRKAKSDDDAWERSLMLVFAFLS
jgi:hypothetical protein